jgi:glycine hydroxymethyltransferase
MGVDEMRRVGSWIASALRAPDDEANLAKIRDEIRTLCQAFPVPAAGAATVPVEA